MLPKLPSIRLPFAKLGGSAAVLGIALLFFVVVATFLIEMRDFLGREFVMWTFGVVVLLFLLVFCAITFISLGSEAATRGVSAVLDRLDPGAQRMAINLILSQPNGSGAPSYIEVTGNPVESVSIAAPSKQKDTVGDL